MYEPRLFNRECGGWLALAPPESPLRIAVTGPTEEAAKVEFQRSIERWELLLSSARGTGEVDARQG
jgi:hypothetical protein